MFVHVPEPDEIYYRVVYGSQNGDHTTLQARDPSVNAYGYYSPDLLQAAASHLNWRIRTPSPFVSVFSNFRHAHNWALWCAKQRGVTYVALCGFVLPACLLIDVEAFVWTWQLPMEPYYQDEFLVPNGIYGFVHHFEWYKEPSPVYEPTVQYYYKLARSLQRQYTH